MNFKNKKKLTDDKFPQKKSFLKIILKSMTFYLIYTKNL